MGSIAGMVSGLISQGQDLPQLNLAALYDTIKNAGAEQQRMINALPPEIQANLREYAATQDAAGAKYQGQIQQQGQNYLSQVGDIYGPNSDAALAQNAANKQQIYSTVPGSQNAIREALAGTGGLARGNAGAALAQPYVQAAGQYGQAAANVNAQQTQAGQQAAQQALQVVNSMETGMFQQLFGMTRDQAQTILTTGNQALQTQLAQLINESTNRENATLGLQGAESQNAYQNAAIRNAQQLAVWNGLASPITGSADAALQGWYNSLSGSAGGGGGGGGGGGLPPGMDVGSASYLRNAAAMAPALMA